MFKRIKKIFSRSFSEQFIADEKSNKSGTPKIKVGKISYNPELIDSLKSDHQNLLSSYQLIMESAKEKHYPLLLKTPNEFSNLLSTHLTKEGVELYVFIEFSSHDDERKILRDFRLEMGEIASVVMSVINKYTNIPVSDENVVQFTKDFSELGSVLVDRIEREEKILYPLYRSS